MPTPPDQSRFYVTLEQEAEPLSVARIPSVLINILGKSSIVVITEGAYMIQIARMMLLGEIVDFKDEFRVFNPNFFEESASIWRKLFHELGRKQTREKV